MKIYEKGFLKRNKKFLIIALIIFLVATVLAIIVAYNAIGVNYGIITKTIINESQNNPTTSFNPDVGLDTVDLFLHNLGSDLLIIVGGVFFSIISLAVVVFNAVLIGSPFGSDFTFAALSILPHGIIEYSASIIALAAAFNITKLEILMIKNRKFREVIDENKILLKDTLLMTILMIVLLIIAAIIECNLTSYVIYWYFS